MIYVGIDVAKDKHDCFAMDYNGEILIEKLTITNNLDGFETLYNSLMNFSDSLYNIKVGLEATGHYSNNILNFKIQPTGNQRFTLQNAIAHQEWMTTDGYRSLSNFTTLETDSIDFDIGSFINAVDKNFYFEMFFTINGYDYKIDFRSAEESSTSVSAICTMSKTVA